MTEDTDYRFILQITESNILWFSPQAVDDASHADLKNRVSPAAHVSQ